LYFIPAMSPTLFFADARGLPFVLGGDKYKEIKDIYKYCKDEKEKTSTIKKTIKEIYGFLTIPKLHDFMEKKVDGELMHDNIQSFNISPLEPKYGIDANRDYHNLLKSTDVFYSFINNLGANSENTTVFMMHGYDSKNRMRAGYDNYKRRDITGQGAVYGPYLEKDDKMYLDDKLMRNTDLLTLCLFGYKNQIINNVNEVTRSKNYMFDFDSKPNKYYGEWTQILDKQNIKCYDIELAENYRQGTRGKIGNEQYSSDFVINRRNAKTKNGDNMRFFNEKDSGKFVSLDNIDITFVYQPKDGERENRLENENISLSFYDFLKEFYILLKKVKENCKEVK